MHIFHVNNWSLWDSLGSRFAKDDQTLLQCCHVADLIRDSVYQILADCIIPRLVYIVCTHGLWNNHVKTQWCICISEHWYIQAMMYLYRNLSAHVGSPLLPLPPSPSPFPPIFAKLRVERGLPVMHPVAWRVPSLHAWCIHLAPHPWNSYCREILWKLHPYWMW